MPEEKISQVLEEDFVQEQAALEQQLKNQEQKPFQTIGIFRDATEEQWEDWHWQMKNRVTNLDDLSKIVLLSPEEENGINTSSGRLSMAITPYWALLMDPFDIECPVRRQAVPSVFEHIPCANELVDPCAEDRDSPAP